MHFFGGRSELILSGYTWIKFFLLDVLIFTWTDLYSVCFVLSVLCKYMVVTMRRNYLFCAKCVV